MKELLMVGAAAIAGIAAFFVLRSHDCPAWLLSYGSVGAGLIIYLVLKTLFW